MHCRSPYPTTTKLLSSRQPILFNVYANCTFPSHTPLLRTVAVTDTKRRPDRVRYYESRP